MAKQQRVVVLLRGVNVGRAKRISMADFSAILTDLGATDIRTVLNSGNAVCTTDRKPTALATAVGAEIEQRLGFSSDVIIRSANQLAAVLESNPLGSVATDASRHLVMFLGTAPTAADVAALQAIDLDPEQWVLDGEELHVWLPNGVADSQVIKALNKGVLGVTWTGRNWSTVQKLHDLM